jgi:EpsI family protein
MHLNKVGILLAALMCVASVGAIVARPSVEFADQGAKMSLDAMIPEKFGNWRNEPQRISQVVNPQTQELLDKLYSQILTRTYVNPDGYRIMLSLAYGADQRGALQAHKPEVCYPAQGFKLQKTEALPLATPIGAIPAQRLMTSLGPRQEPVTYWFTMGDKAVQSKLERRLVQLTYGLTGRIPDGLLFRISSIDADQARANLHHDQFVNQLLQAIPPGDRARLSGLSATTQP